MGLSILSNENKTEAVVVNDSICPAQPLGFVFYDEEGEIVERVGRFIDWLKPRDIRRVDNLDKLWMEFIDDDI